MSKRNAKYHTSHAKPSRPKSKITAVSQNKACQNFKSNCKKYCDDRWHPQPPLMPTHICQRFRSLQKIPCLPCEWRSVRWLAPATQNNVSDFKSVLDAPRAPWKIDSSKNERAKRETCFVRLRACAVEKETFARACGQRPKIRASTLIKTRLVQLLRDSLSAGMLWGESSIPHACESSCIACLRLERKAGF